MHDIITYIKKAQAYAKSIVAAVGSVLTALVGVGNDLGVKLVPEDAQATVMFALAALTAFSTWAVPNFDPDGKPE